MKLILAVALFVAASLLALPAAASAENYFYLQGHAVHVPECQRRTQVSFWATFAHGKFAHVSKFTVFNLNLPNKTPPWPEGRRARKCVPGDPQTFEFIDYKDPLHPELMPFWPGEDDPYVFGDKSKYVLGGETFTEWRVHGTLDLFRRNGRFHVKSSGHLVYAFKTADCTTKARRCKHSTTANGRSSDIVKWRASGGEETHPPPP